MIDRYQRQVMDAPAPAPKPGTQMESALGVVGTVGGGIVGGVYGGPAGASLGANIGGQLGGAVGSMADGKKSDEAIQPAMRRMPETASQAVTGLGEARSWRNAQAKQKTAGTGAEAAATNLNANTSDLSPKQIEALNYLSGL